MQVNIQPEVPSPRLRNHPGRPPKKAPTPRAPPSSHTSSSTSSSQHPTSSSCSSYSHPQISLLPLNPHLHTYCSTTSLPDPTLAYSPVPDPPLLQRAPTSYSCESIYLQCCEASDSEPESIDTRKDTEAPSSTISTEFEYYRPTRGSLTTMDKLDELDFEWTQGVPAPDAAILPIANSMVFNPNETDIRPQFFADSIDTSKPRTYTSSETMVPLPVPPPRLSYAEKYNNYKVVRRMERSAPVGSSDHGHEDPEDYQYNTAGYQGDAYSASTSTTDHSQRFLLGSSSSDSVIQGDQRLGRKHVESYIESSQVPAFHPDGELGLDSLKTSKAEQIDQMYQDRNDDTGGDNQCLWITCKLFTWTLLVCIAAATIITAKLSTVLMTQGLIIKTPVSDIIPVNATITQQYDNSQHYDSDNVCQTKHRKQLSEEVMGNPSVLNTVVYLTRRTLFMDASVFVMLMFMLLIPPVVGFLAAIYGFFRWEGVRRARLSCKAILTTFIMSIVEAMGVCLFIIQVLPYLDAHWSLIVPMFIMTLPSVSHLIRRSHTSTLAMRIIPWFLLLGSNIIAMVIIYVILTGVFISQDLDVQLIWSLPLSIVLIGVSWMAPVINVQVDGSYKEDDLDKLHGKEFPEAVHDLKVASLRGRHKILATFCRLFSYPLAIFSVISLIEGYDVWLSLQNHIIPILQHHMAHHYIFTYFLLGIFTSFFSPIAVWGVFTAAIELRLTLRAGVWRPVSGSFFVMILTVIVTVILAVNDVPCWVVKPVECCYHEHLLNSLMVGLTAVLLLVGNLPVIYNIMIANHVILMPFDKVYTTSLFNAVLPDPWVWLNVRPSSLHQRAKIPDFQGLRQRSKIYICTTMYREEEEEMLELLKSVKRINDGRTPSKPMFEAHVFFDGAYQIVNGRPRFNGFALQLVALVEKTFDTKLNMFSQKATPYGLQWEVPLWCEGTNKAMMLYIHLKDNTIVKKKKRWSQIMYMAWALEHDAEVPVEDRYVLITDGDTKFFEKGPVALLDSLLISPEAAASVGRVRPIITFNPLVWYQAFEYAASFWIYKASNDQLGTDLCCSGCFTMYRGSMLKQVIKDYAAECNNAEDFLMIDMGEDLWLSTLLIRSGWKLKYSSVADVYTRAPGGLEEYYKQRRRWYLSSLAYFFFFIREMKRFKFANAHVTITFLVYQGLLLFFPLISTSTLGIILAIAVGNSFQIPFLWSALIIGFCFVGQLLVCMFLPSRWQVKGSALLAIVPSLCTIGVVIIVSINVVKDYIDAFESVNGTYTATIRIHVNGELPLPLPSLLITILIALIIMTAMLHPKEFFYIFYIVAFIIGSTIGFTFLRPYMLCNVTDQSWGTRETKMAREDEQEEPSFKGKLQNCCDAMMCCCRKKQEPVVIPESIDLPDTSTSGIDSSHMYGSSIHSNYSSLDYSASTSQHIIDDMISIPESTHSVIDEMDDMGLSQDVKDRMIEIRSELMIRTKTYQVPLDREDRFWERLIDLKLSNNMMGEEKKKRLHDSMQEGLRSFQSNMLAVYIILNIIWIAMLAAFWEIFGSDIQQARWGRHIDVVLIIAIPYTAVNVLQFIAMFIHRMGIWLYLLARTKCRLCSLITCGYPTRKSEHYAVTISNITRNLTLYQEQQRQQREQELQDEMERSPIRIPRAIASPTPIRHAGKPSYHSPKLGLPSLTQGGVVDIRHKDQEGEFPRPSSQRSSNSSFSFVPAIRESSKFVNSRWLLGQGNYGMLTRGETARGLVLSASQESMNQLIATQQGKDPTAVWAHTNTYLPHSVSQTYLANQDQHGEGARVSPRIYRPRSATADNRYNSPLMRRARREAPPIPPLPARTIQEERRLDVRDNPTQYLHNLARRRLEVANGGIPNNR